MTVKLWGQVHFLPNWSDILLSTPITIWVPTPVIMMLHGRYILFSLTVVLTKLLTHLKSFLRKFLLFCLYQVLNKIQDFLILIFQLFIRQGADFGPLHTLILNNLYSTKPIKLQLSVSSYLEFLLRIILQTIFLSLPPFWNYDVILKVEYVALRRLTMKLHVINGLPCFLNITDITIKNM